MIPSRNNNEETGDIMEEQGQITEEGQTSSFRSEGVSLCNEVVPARRDSKIDDLIGDNVVIDLSRDLLSVSSRGYVIRTSFTDAHGVSQPCILKRCDVVDQNPPDLVRLQHPHVVHLIGFWIEEKYLFLVMEVLDGDLAKLILRTKSATPLSIHVAVDLMLQIAKGMLYLHEMGVSYSLKCDNVLYKLTDRNKTEAFRVGDVVVKLGGFGCSSPAQLGSQTQDVLDFGLTCLEILTGNKRSDKIARSSIPKDTPFMLKDLILSCQITQLTLLEVYKELLRAQTYILQTYNDDFKVASQSMESDTVQTKMDCGHEEIFAVHQLHPQLGDIPTSLLAVRATLVFFHGFRKVPDEWRRTWMTRDNKLVWPQKWLPEDLGAENLRVLSVSLDENTTVSNICNRHEIGKNLVESLVLSPEWMLGESGEAIFLIGHSFGGVLIKYLVTKARHLVQLNIRDQEAQKCEKFLERLAKIVFYSVPHASTGQELEDYVSKCKKIAPLKRSSFLQSLEGDTHFVADMNRLSTDFESALPEKLQILAFLEGKAMSKESVLVTKKSCEGASHSWEWHKIDKDNHFEVCRPNSKSHTGYRILLEHLQQHLKNLYRVTSTLDADVTRVPGMHQRDDLSTASEAFPAKSLSSQEEGSSVSAVVSVTPEHSTLPIFDSNTPNARSRSASRWTVIDETKRREKETIEKLSEWRNCRLRVVVTAVRACWRLQQTTAKKDHNYCADSSESDDKSLFSMRSPGRSPLASDSRQGSLDRQERFRVGDHEGDLQKLYKLLDIGSPAELGIGKSDWDARKESLYNSRPTSPRSASQDFGQSSPDDFRFRQPYTYEPSGVSPPSSPVVSPPRLIEKEWRAHRDAVKLQPVMRTNSPYKRSPPPSTAFPIFEMGGINRSSTASPASLIGRGSLTRSDGLDRRHSEPILELPPPPGALLSPSDGAGKTAQFDFNQGGVSGKWDSFLGDVDDLPTAPVVPSTSWRPMFSKDSHRTKSVGSSLRWKSSKDSLEVDPFAKLPEEISVESRAADSEDSEIAEKEKAEEVSTPSSGDSSTDMLPGVFPKKPNWSTWAKGEFLGSGPFGTVYEGVGSNGMFFAVKEVSLVHEGKTGKQAIRQLEQEIALLSEIQHPNIVQYLGTERDDEKLYIFLELVSKGSLALLYEKYEFFYDQVRVYTKQILLGLKYLHDRKIIHRDIKCANILVDASGMVKLADFGMAKHTDKLDLLESFLGSAHWMAPEVVNPRRSYDLKADIWSLGCTVLEMATGKPPYGEMETHSVLWKVGNAEAPTIPEELDEVLKDFIRSCLEVNVANRPTCDLLLTHPFITGDRQSIYFRQRAEMTGPVKLVPIPELMPSFAEETSIDISAPHAVRGQPKSMRKIRSERDAGIALAPSPFPIWKY